MSGPRDYLKNLQTIFSTVYMKFMADLWTCSGCSQPGDANGYRDSQEHILVCEGYSRLREGKDLCSDDGLVKYFQEVISVRLSTL